MNKFKSEYASVLSMRMECEMMSLSKDEYKKKATELSESDKKSLALIIGRHYSDELTRAGLQEVEVLALLLEREDAHLSEWRLAIEKIRAGEDGKS